MQSYLIHYIDILNICLHFKTILLNLGNINITKIRSGLKRNTGVLDFFYFLMFVR